MQKPLAAALLLVAASGLASTTVAQTARSGSGAANAQTARQLQQLAQERTALQDENQKLKSELAELKKQLDGMSAEQASLRRRAGGADATVAAATNSRAVLEAELERRKAREAELVAEFRKTIGLMRDVEADRSRLAADARVTGANLKQCSEANVELAGIAIEALERYENAGFGHAVARAEPFSRLARTRVENLVDEYRAKVEALRVPMAAESASPAP
jgi:chromosome segregation ATPase